MLFDLPSNPDLLEQRIGRLDRIGQQHAVEIHVPYVEDGPAHVLLRWYHDGLDAFERPCAIGRRVRDLFHQRLNVLLNADPAQSIDDSLDRFIADTQQAAQGLLQDLEQGRDRLLELGSCDPQRAALVVQSLVDASRSQELASYMEAVFDLFGVEHEADGAHKIVVRPGNHMLCDEFPQLPEDGASATYSRPQALAREELEFLTWEHPMVNGAMDLLIEGELGNATLCTLKALPLKAGTLLLEGVFVVTCPAPRALALNRYLSMDVQRHVVSSDGSDLTQALPASALDQRAQDVPKGSAAELVRHAWPDIEKLVVHAQKLAKAAQTTIVETATQNAQQHHQQELDRMRALAEVNPNIRDEEVRFLESQAQDVQRYLSTAQLRLDAIRVGIVTG